MHEFLLHSLIASPRHSQVLHILAGVAAHQPVPLLEEHLVYQQLKRADAAPTSKKGPTNQQAFQAQRLRYHQLVRDFTFDAVPTEWKLRVEETPEPGVRDVNSRRVLQRSVSEAELARFREGQEGYRLTSQYVTKGARFVHGNVIIDIKRIYTITNSPSDQQEPLDAPPPTQDQLEILDKSGAYIVEACVRTEDGPSPELRKKAMGELLKFAQMLEGAVDLRAVERLALDTEVKAS